MHMAVEKEITNPYVCSLLFHACPLIFFAVQLHFTKSISINNRKFVPLFVRFRSLSLVIACFIFRASLFFKRIQKEINSHLTVFCSDVSMIAARYRKYLHLLLLLRISSFNSFSFSFYAQTIVLIIISFVNKI